MERLDVGRRLQMLYRFNNCDLDLERGCLRVAGREVDLRPKSFDVLKYLLQNQGRLVRKQEILEAVWPHVAVTDESLARCISEIRCALGDDRHKLIKTVPRRGYLFAAIAEIHDYAKAPAAAPPNRQVPAAGSRPSLAVLAFANLSGDPTQEYLSDGITEDIITELSRFSELSVIARNSSFTYKGKAVDVRQIGRELGVRYVLEGSFRRAGGRVRITAQLIDALTGAHRWAERYDRELMDVFVIQDEAARTIAAMLTAHVNKAEVERTLLKGPDSWEAYDYYMRAADTFTSYWSSYKVEEVYETRRLLERSISLDSKYARAYAMLSNTHTTVWAQPLDGDYLNPAALVQACQLAGKAVQLDPNLPQAHALLGMALNWMHQHDASLEAFERAIALNPNYTDWRFASALVLAGEPERAIKAVEAHMRLDPFYLPTAPSWLGLSYYLLKQYSKALSALRESATRAPNLRGAHVLLAAAYAQLGQLEEARAEAAEVLRLEPQYTIEGTQKPLFGFRLAAHTDHLSDGLRKAGLPER